MRTACALLLAVSLFSPAAGAFEGPLFPNPVLPISAEPWAMVSGDFDEDGQLDLAIPGYDAFEVSILLGNGDGTFRRSGLAMQFTGLIAVGDFNEDDHQDLAVVDAGSGVTVFLGNGDGTFDAGTNFTTTGSFSWGLAVADFNDDQHDDIALSFVNTSPTAVLLGDGAGGFSSPLALTAGAQYDIAAADLDHDGEQDLVGANGGQVTVRLGNGDGSFTSAPSLNVGTGASRLLVADLNDDTDPDIVVTNSDSDDLSVLMGNGDGTFAAEVRYAVTDDPFDVDLADLDGDGNDDLIVGNNLAHDVSMLPGNGDGTFDAEIPIPTYQATGQTVAADLDGDGRLDLAVASALSDTLTVLRGNGDGTFPAPDPHVVESTLPNVVATRFGDFDEDGRLDVAAVGDSSVTVAVADGTGAFTVTASSGTGTAVPVALALGDLDGDANLDVITANTTTNDGSVLLGNGDGTLDAEFRVPFARQPVAIALGRFDAGTTLDAVVVSLFPSPIITVLPGLGNGTFASGTSRAVGPSPISVVTGDLNGDGNLDVAVANQGSSDVSVLLGAGDGTLAPETRYPVGTLTGAYAGALRIVDIDGDGHVDLVSPVSYSLSVLHGAGDGTFAAPVMLGIGDYWRCFDVADVDGDGRQDLVGGLGDPAASVRLGLPEGGFGPPRYFAAKTFARGIAADDTDGDGRRDLIVVSGTNSPTGNVPALALLNLGVTTFGFADKITLTWPEISGALSYNIYRGPLSDLVDADEDGLPDTGYGTCQNGLDGDTTDVVYTDTEIPASGAGFFYVAAVVDWEGERDLGTTSTGLPRVPGVACP